MNDQARKAAAFDWLCAQIQAIYDGHSLLGVGPDMSINACTVWGHRDRCGVLAEIRWEDRRDEPLDLLAAIEKAMGG